MSELDTYHVLNSIRKSLERIAEALETHNELLDGMIYHDTIDGQNSLRTHEVNYR